MTKRTYLIKGQIIFILIGLMSLPVRSNAQVQTLHWAKMSAGVWVAKAGHPESVNFTAVSGVKPKLDAINAMADVAFPLSENEIKTTVFDGKTYLQFPLEPGEQIFGLGLNFQTVGQAAGFSGSIWIIITGLITGAIMHPFLSMPHQKGMVFLLIRPDIWIFG